MAACLRPTCLIGLSLLLIVACGGDRRVTVTRDALNHPAIRVDDVNPDHVQAMLYEEQGYVEAYDRLIQMDLSRRMSQGRLSEIFGEASEGRDRAIIAVGLPRAIARSFDRLKAEHPRVVIYLEAFAKGVNRRLIEIQDKRTPMRDQYRLWTRDSNFTFREEKFARWQPIDSIAAATGIGFHLSSSMLEKLQMGKIAAEVIGEDLSPENIDRFKKLFDMRAIEKEFIVGASRAGGGRALTETTRRASESRRGIPRGAFFMGAEMNEPGFPFTDRIRKAPMGSNNWVVSRQFAGGKSAYLANDPHILIRFPTGFYELGLGDVRGVNMPGVPGIMIGHNARIAWGFTNNPADVDDIYIEQQRNGGTEVFHEEKWKKVETLVHELKVRQADGSLKSKEVKIRWVPHHGPIISDHIEELKEAVAKINRNMAMDSALSYRWTGHEGTAEMAAIIGVNEARNFEEFKAALKYFEVGAQNVVYVDVDGNIGYYSHAKYPMRNYLSKDGWPSGVPVLGSGEMDWATDASGKTLWRAVVPELYNPPSGRIITANNDPFGHSAERGLSDLKDYYGSNFSTGIRAKRIAELLDAKRGNLKLEDMQAVQLDRKDNFALKLIRFLNENTDDSRLKGPALAVKHTLRDWNGFVTREQYAPVVSDTWLRSLAAEHFTGLPDLLGSLGGATLSAKTIYHHLNDSLAADAAGERRDAAKALLVSSLERTARALPNKPTRWGQLNIFRYHNDLAGIVPSVVTPSFERDGSFETVDVAGISKDGAHYGPNFRLVLELEEGKPIRGVNILAGGNYDPQQSVKWLDELYLWINGKYREIVPFAE